MADPIPAPSMLDDIAAALVKAGLGHSVSSSEDWQIYVGYMQAAPDRAICLYETGGMPPETTMPLDHPGLQVRVRGKPDDYQALRAKMQAIYLFLHANNETVTIGPDYVYCYAQQSGVIPMGEDELRRPSVVQNYKISKNRATPS